MDRALLFLVLAGVAVGVFLYLKRDDDANAEQRVNDGPPPADGDVSLATESAAIQAFRAEVKRIRGAFESLDVEDKAELTPNDWSNVQGIIAMIDMVRERAQADGITRDPSMTSLFELYSRVDGVNKRKKSAQVDLPDILAPRGDVVKEPHLFDSALELDEQPNLLSQEDNGEESAEPTFDAMDESELAPPVRVKDIDKPPAKREAIVMSDGALGYGVQTPAKMVFAGLSLSPPTAEGAPDFLELSEADVNMNELRDGMDAALQNQMDPPTMGNGVPGAGVEYQTDMEAERDLARKAPDQAFKSNEPPPSPKIPAPGLNAEAPPPPKRHGPPVHAQKAQAPISFNSAGGEARPADDVMFPEEAAEHRERVIQSRNAGGDAIDDPTENRMNQLAAFNSECQAIREMGLAYLNKQNPLKDTVGEWYTEMTNALAAAVAKLGAQDPRTAGTLRTEGKAGASYMAARQVVRDLNALYDRLERKRPISALQQGPDVGRKRRKSVADPLEAQLAQGTEMLPTEAFDAPGDDD